MLFYAIINNYNKTFLETAKIISYLKLNLHNDIYKFYYKEFKIFELSKENYILFSNKIKNKILRNIFIDKILFIHKYYEFLKNFHIQDIKINNIDDILAAINIIKLENFLKSEIIIENFSIILDISLQNILLKEMSNCSIFIKENFIFNYKDYNIKYIYTNVLDFINIYTNYHEKIKNFMRYFQTSEIRNSLRFFFILENNQFKLYYKMHHKNILILCLNSRNEMTKLLNLEAADKNKLLNKLFFLDMCYSLDEKHEILNTIDTSDNNILRYSKIESVEDFLNEFVLLMHLRSYNSFHKLTFKNLTVFLYENNFDTTKIKEYEKKILELHEIIKNFKDINVDIVITNQHIKLYEKCFDSKEEFILYDVKIESLHLLWNKFSTYFKDLLNLIQKSKDFLNNLNHNFNNFNFIYSEGEIKLTYFFYENNMYSYITLLNLKDHKKRLTQLIELLSSNHLQYKAQFINKLNFVSLICSEFLKLKEDYIIISSSNEKIKDFLNNFSIGIMYKNILHMIIFEDFKNLLKVMRDNEVDTMRFFMHELVQGFIKLSVNSNLEKIEILITNKIILKINNKIIKELSCADFKKVKELFE
jgi:hypothetical protein